MAYRETAAPAALRDLVECLWTNDTPHPGARVLPDGCMDLIAIDGRVVVAGPDTTAAVSAGSSTAVTGLRFRPGALPRLLGVPAAELADRRVPLDDVCASTGKAGDLVALATALAAGRLRRRTAPWELSTLHHVTRRFATGAAVPDVAGEIGWSTRTVQRQCEDVYGYGPATLRRVLRFRRAVALVQAGCSSAHAAATAGYADQPHLHRDVREFAGVPISQLGNAANRSTDVPSGSTTVA